MKKVKLTTNVHFDVLGDGGGHYHYGYQFSDDMGKEWAFGVMSVRRSWRLDGFTDGVRVIHQTFGKLSEVRCYIAEVKNAVVALHAPLRQVSQGLSIFQEVSKYNPSHLAYYFPVLRNNPELRNCIRQAVQKATVDYIERWIPDLPLEHRVWFMKQIDELGLVNLYVHLGFNEGRGESG